MYSALLVFLLNAMRLQVLGTGLRHNWIDREPTSAIANHIANHQAQCTRKVYYHEFGNSGMGSDVHVWTQALCNAMQEGAVLVQIDEAWIWNDRDMCGQSNSSQPLSCYFNQQSNCPLSWASEAQVIDWLNKYDKCPSYIHDLASRTDFRAAAVEYLFSKLNPALVREAEESINSVFGAPIIPDNMITVHVRWGDKRKEMDLVHQRDYVAAIQSLVDKHHIADPHVFITTESSVALEKVSRAVQKAGKNWHLHHYAPAVFDSSKEVSMADIATHTSGKLGRASLVSLLLAMEARYYVVTSGSNWSRLIDELRKNVVDPTCGGNCTDILDLRTAIAKAQDW